MMRLLRDAQFRLWLALVGSAALIIGASYTMAQQSTRLSADDLPLTTAQMAKQELQAGSSPTDVVPVLKTDLKYDDSIFTIVTDNTKHVLASSAVLDGQTPLPPGGVFDFTDAHSSDHFSWEPEVSVRLATRVLKYQSDTSSGFVITGQSLKPYEERIGTYTWIALAAWLAVIAWSFLLILLPRVKTRNH